MNVFGFVRFFLAGCIGKLSGVCENLCLGFAQSNPENTVGVLTMAGKGVRVLVTPTSDLGKILACMHG